MAVWRPPEAIRVKVIGLAWRESRLLAAEVETDGGGVKGVRPLGGSIQLGVWVLDDLCHFRGQHRSLLRANAGA